MWGKFWVKARLQQDDKAQRLLPMVVLSYCLQLMQLDLTLLPDETKGQQNDDFVISHFLLFFSSALGALAVMMATLQIETSPAVAQARPASASQDLHCDSCDNGAHHCYRMGGGRYVTGLHAGAYCGACVVHFLF
jgi:hypothetical protein